MGDTCESMLLRNHPAIRWSNCRILLKLMRPGDDPQLFFHAPAPASLPPVDDLDRAVRHDFKEHLKVDFKVYSFATPPIFSKATLTGRLL